jgi:hypothetical protein
MEVYMWECKVCRRVLDDEDLTCWSCRGKREDVEFIQDQDGMAQSKEGPDFSQEEKSVDIDPEELAKEKEKYKNLPALPDKLKYFVEKLSANDALDSRIIKENLVISRKWVVINSFLIMDILVENRFPMEVRIEIESFQSCFLSQNE